ncbi:MAG: HAMP domain-containing histidine kinase [Cyclobacteriaceae bacterium]|nr:HAMP domain-containing histidine kinase [Cyclobacteriaceae bacterium]
MKRLRNYFLSDFIEGKDILEKSRDIITFNISYLAALLTSFLFIVTILSGSYVVALRAVISVLAIVFMWFYSKKYKNTNSLARLLIYASGFMMFSNIFIVFQQVDFSLISIFLSTLVFSFFILNRNEALLYSAIFSLFILVFTFFHLIDYQWISIPPQELKLHEQVLAAFVGLLLMVYVLYQFDLTFLAFVNFTNSQKLELKEAKESAEEMNRLKSNFLANMSHEIRTPINGIMGLADIMLSEVDNPEVKEMVYMQKESSKRLLNTINSILQLSKLEAESSSFRLKNVLTENLISDSVKLLEPLAWKKNISLINYSDLKGVHCYASEEILFQVFNNIIGNAIKFTDKGSVIIRTKISNTRAYIIVSDTGIGISEEFLPRIFNTFEQESQGLSRSYEGTGLGLSITKKYLELIGGNISVESIKGEGSKFTITFPIKTNP